MTIALLIQSKVSRNTRFGQPPETLTNNNDPQTICRADASSRLPDQKLAKERSVRNRSVDCPKGYVLKIYFFGKTLWDLPDIGWIGAKAVSRLVLRFSDMLSTCLGVGRGSSRLDSCTGSDRRSPALLRPMLQGEADQRRRQGLVERVRVDGAHVEIDIVLTTGWCPFSMHMLTMLEPEVGAVDGVSEVHVNITWEREWTPERLSEDGRGSGMGSGL